MYADIISTHAFVLQPWIYDLCQQLEHLNHPVV